MNDNDRPKTAAALSTGNVPDGAHVRDRAAERAMLATRLERTLKPGDIAAYASAVLARLDAHGDHVASLKAQPDLLREIAEELLDVGGWAIVTGYAHPRRSSWSTTH